MPANGGIPGGMQGQLQDKAVDYAALTQHLQLLNHQRKSNQSTSYNQEAVGNATSSPRGSPNHGSIPTHSDSHSHPQSQSNVSGSSNKSKSKSKNEVRRSMGEMEIGVGASASGHLDVRVSAAESGERFETLLLGEINKVRQFLSFKKKELKQKLLHLRRKFNNIVFWWESGFPDLEAHLDDIYEQFKKLGTEVAQLLKFVESNVALVKKSLAKYDASTGHLAGSSMLHQYKTVLEDLADTEDFIQLVVKTEAALRETRLVKKQVLGLIPKPGVPVKSSRSASLYDEDVVVLDDGQSETHDVDWTEHDRILGDLERSTPRQTYSSFFSTADDFSADSRLKRANAASFQHGGISDFFASQLFVNEATHAGESLVSSENSSPLLPLVVVTFCVLCGASSVLVYPLSIVYADLTSLTTTFVLICLGVITLTSWVSLWAFSREALESRKEGLLFACCLLFIGNLLFSIPLARHLSLGEDGIYGVIDPVDIQLSDSPSWAQVCMILACMCFGVATVASTVIPASTCQALNISGFKQSKGLATFMVAACMIGEAIGIGSLAIVATGHDRIGVDLGLDVNSVVFGMHVNVMNVACVILSGIWLLFTLLACSVTEQVQSITGLQLNLRNPDDWYYYDTNMTRKQRIWMISVLLQSVLRFTHTLCFFALMFTLKRDLVVSWNTLLLGVLVAVVSTNLPAMVAAVKVSACLGAHRALRFVIILGMLTAVVANIFESEFVDVSMSYRLEQLVCFVSLLCGLSRVAEYTLAHYLCHKVGWIDAALVDYSKLGPVLVLNTAKYVGSTMAFVVLAAIVNYGQINQVASVAFTTVAVLNAVVLLVMYLL